MKGETQDVELATNRVPSPSKDPSRGYRNLAMLSLIGQLIPPPVNTDNNRELFALHRNPETTEYAVTYEPSGLNLETHFILIFNLQSISPSPSLGPNPLTPFSRNDINSWAWNAVDFSPIPSPTSITSQSPTTSAITPSQSVSVTALSTTLSGVPRRRSPLGVNVPTTSNYPPYLHEADEAMNTLFSTEDANTPCVAETYNSDGIDHGTYWQYPDGNAIATGNPIPQVVVESAIMDDVELDLLRSDENATTAANLMPGVVVEPAIAGNVELDVLHPYQNATTSDTLTTRTGMDVTNLCHCLGITQETIAGAKFLGGNRPLLTMVLNHRAMMSILERLHFCDQGPCPRIMKGKKVTFDDGLELSLTDVLDELVLAPRKPCLPNIQHHLSFSPTHSAFMAALPIAHDACTS